MDFLNRPLPFPLPLTKSAAQKIAADHAGLPEENFVDITPPETPPLWFYEPDAFFCFSCPWNDGKDGMVLRSARTIAISRLTGEILYDGSAQDEG